MRASSRAGTSRLCRNAQTYRACQGAAAVEEEDIVDGADSEEEASHLGEEATVVDTVDGVGASRHTRRRCLEIRRGELLWSTNCRHHFQYRDVFRCKIRVREGQRRHRLYFSARASRDTGKPRERISAGRRVEERCRQRNCPLDMAEWVGSAFPVLSGAAFTMPPQDRRYTVQRLIIGFIT